MCPFVAGRCFGIPAVQMDAPQVELILQVEVVVDDDLVMMVFRQQGEQALRINGFRAWLSQVKQVQSLFKQCGKYLVLLHEEVWRRQ